MTKGELEKTRTIKLPSRYFEMIKWAAKKNNRTFWGQVKQIIEEWMERLERKNGKKSK